MSEIERLRLELHQIGGSAKQAAGGLSGFKMEFAQHSAQVEALIAGTSTGADKTIAQVLDVAGKAVDAAVEALASAAQTCSSYADQI